MTFDEATRRLTEMAPEGYRSIAFEKTITREGAISHDCKVYVADYGWHTGQTWSVALKSLRTLMDRKETGQQIPNPKETPKEDIPDEDPISNESAEPVL